MWLMTAIVESAFIISAIIHRDQQITHD